MNNSESYPECNDQMWYDEFIFGVECMHSPRNAKLLWVRDYIVIKFSHSNYWPDVGSYSFDTLWIIHHSGQYELVLVGWDTFHSLEQRLLFDRSMIISSSLGDYKPQDIKFYSALAIKGAYSTSHIFHWKENMVESDSGNPIPGDHDWHSCGRLGGLVRIGDINI